MKKLTLFIFISMVIFSVNCSKEKWKGRIYKEAGVTVIESEGSGVWGEKINEKIKFKENLSLGIEEGEEFWQFLGSYKLPEETRLNTIDPENNLYFVQQEPFPRVVRSTLDLK